MIVFSCSNCGQKYEKDLSLAGKKVRCKDCGHVFVIPTPSRMPSKGTAEPARRAEPQEQPRAVPKPAAPVKAAPVLLDPYGLYDDPVPATPPDDSDEEFSVPQRSRATGFKAKSKPRRATSSGPNPGIPLFDGLPWYVYATVLGILLLGFPLKTVSRDLAGYSQLTGFALMLLIMLYGVIGLVAVPFRESLYHGFTCWFLPPFLIAYLFTRWDAMKGSFLTCFGGMGLAVVVGVFAPLVNGGDGKIHDLESAASPSPPGLDPGGRMAADNPAPTPPRWPGLLDGVQPPAMSNTVTLVVSGLNHESGKAFGDKLGELVGRVSGGFHISSAGSGGKSTYSISMVNAVGVQTFADQIKWAKVTRIEGQTIRIDATAAGN
jgi:predicted Zn finger-like uncharacterized protein